MYAPEQENDSDEDAEVYFLKPVNEYNIADKIKEANKELFASPIPQDNATMNRKVQFKHDLEEFDNGDGDIVIINLDDNTTTVMTTSTIKEESVEEDVDAGKEAESEVEEICEEIESCNIKETNQSILLEEDEDDAEDDQLSVIAASYLKNELDDVEEANLLDAEFKASPKKPRPNRLSFRIKKKPSRMTCSKSVDAINDVKLNYKICCEYRDSQIEKLPKYTGYLSEYGLSQEQWDKREQKYNKNKQVALEKNIYASESEIQKMADNERAFTSWLRNKMRFPINKTRNMFDFKSSRSKKSAKVGSQVK